jgi:hypothetical protein
VAMHGWFFEETSCGKKVLQCPSQCFDTVVKNYDSTSTTVTTNHNMQKKIPTRSNTLVAPTKRQSKTP